MFLLEDAREHAKMYARPCGCPRTPCHRRNMFNIAHIELFYIAQAIGAIYASDEQQALDAARRQAMREMESSTSKDVLVKPTRRIVKAIRWTEYLLTPELDSSPTLSFKTLTKATATRLKRAHRAQVQAVGRLLR